MRLRTPLCLHLRTRLYLRLRVRVGVQLFEVNFVGAFTDSQFIVRNWCQRDIEIFINFKQPGCIAMRASTAFQ